MLAAAFRLTRTNGHNIFKKVNKNKMENKQHTPGEWFQSHRPIPNDEEGMYSTQVYTEDGETIATLHWYPMPKREDVFEGKPVLVTGTYREANAKLIAAAPDLLNACFNAMGICDLSKDADKYVFEQLKAAFDKAKGIKSQVVS